MELLIFWLYKFVMFDISIIKEFHNRRNLKVEP